MSHDRSTVEAVVHHYFDGLYEGNADKLGAIFHPSADLRWVEKGELQVLTVPDWLDRVQEAALRQGRRQAARGFHRDHRPLRRIHRLHQGALPVAAALLHRLSGGDEAQRRLADRLEVLPLRSQAIEAGDSAPLTPPPVRANWPGTGIGDRGSQIPDLSDSARGAGGHRAAGAADQRRAGDPAAAGRHRAGLRAGHAVAGTAAGTGAAGGAAAADLFGQRRHELARIQIQSAPDHPAVGRLRDLHGLRGRRRDALPDRAAVEHRLPARRHRRAAGCGGAAGDRPKARAAAPNPRRARGRGTGERRHRADPVSLRGGGDLDRDVFAAEGNGRLLRSSSPAKCCSAPRWAGSPCGCATARAIRRSRSRCR